MQTPIYFVPSIHVENLGYVHVKADAPVPSPNRCEGCAFAVTDPSKSDEAAAVCRLVRAETQDKCSGGQWGIWVPVEFDIPITNVKDIKRFFRALGRIDAGFHLDDNVFEIGTNPDAADIFRNKQACMLIHLRREEARTVMAKRHPVWPKAEDKLFNLMSKYT